MSYGQVKQAVFVLAGTGSLAAVQKDALIKLYYLALRNISKKWTMPIQNWKAALNRFTILFDKRMP